MENSIHSIIPLLYSFNTEGKVSCGYHRAKSCSECPLNPKNPRISYGRFWCNGACTWKHGRCSPRGNITIDKLLATLPSSLIDWFPQVIWLLPRVPGVPGVPGLSVPRLVEEELRRRREIVTLVNQIALPASVRSLQFCLCQ